MRLEKGVLTDRTVPRLKTLLSAKAVFNHGNSTLECMVRDLSSSGAKLSVSQSIVLPDTFELRIAGRDKHFLARVRWRQAETVGVSFVTSQTVAVDAEKLAELQEENTRLRAEVSILNKQVADHRGVRH